MHDAVVLIFYAGLAVVTFLGIGSLIVLAAAVGDAGQYLARRYRHQCPQCDYRPPRITRDADMLIHRVLEHEQARD